jgi:SAM-dependent methyltransferase
MQAPATLSVPRTWNLVAPGYAAEIAPAFSRFAEDALSLARLDAGERVLDVATGPGTLVLAAARAGARASAIDFSPQMIAELRARARREGITEIDARVADARALPYEDGAFDAVFSMFALNLMADRAAAFREIHRVVRRGGRAVVGTPGPMTGSGAFADVLDIVRRAIPDLAFDGELPLCDPAELHHEMSAAGFAQVDVRRLVRSFAYPSVAALWATAGRAAAPIVVAREAMGEARWSRVSDEILRGLERRFGKGPQEVELTVNLALAVKNPLPSGLKRDIARAPGC